MFQALWTNDELQIITTAYSCFIQLQGCNKLEESAETSNVWCKSNTWDMQQKAELQKPDISEFSHHQLSMSVQFPSMCSLIKLLCLSICLSSLSLSSLPHFPSVKRMDHPAGEAYPGAPMQLKRNQMFCVMLHQNAWTETCHGKAQWSSFFFLISSTVCATCIWPSERTKRVTFRPRYQLYCQVVLLLKVLPQKLNTQKDPGSVCLLQASL